MKNTNRIAEVLVKDIAFSEDELREIERAQEMPIVLAEEYPEVTPENAMKFKRINPSRKSDG